MSTSVSTLKKSDPSTIMSGQACPPEIMSVLTLRSQLRASGKRTAFPKEVVDMILAIRAEIPSGEDGDGWNTITRNWRGGSGPTPGARSGGPPPSRTGGGDGSNRNSGGGNHWNVRNSRDSAPSAFRDSHRRPHHHGHTEEGDGWTTVQTKHVHGNRRQSDNPFAVSGAKPVPSRVANTASAEPSPFHSNRATAQPTTTMTPLTVPTSASGGGAGSESAPVTNQPSRTRYTSIFATASAPIESKIISIIQNKLNKFSIANYDEVCDFIKQILGSGETDFLTEFMKLVFSKAAMEETFCPLYARLLKDLSADYPSLTSEMQSLYKNFPQIFEEVDESSTSNMEEFMERNKQRRYRQGYSQFLTELLKQGIVDPTAFTSTVEMIITQMCAVSKQEGKTNNMEEYMNCLSRILKALADKSPEATTMRISLLPVLNEKLTPLTELSVDRPSLSNRIRFGIINALDNVKKVGGKH